MDQRRFSKTAGNENLQKKLAENRRKGSRGQEQVPDIADFMNDMFFGAVNNEKKVYNLTGGGDPDVMEEDDEFDMSSRSTSSRLTQEWLEEAKRLVASSPSRGWTRAEGNSPSRLVGSPRFGVSGPRLSTSSVTERDPLSRSARRHRSVDGFTGDILTKSVKHNHSRNNSQTAIDNSPPSADISPASAVQKWFSNILKPPTAGDPITTASPPTTATTPPPDIIPPRVSIHRRSRFENQSPAPPLPLPPTSPSPSRSAAVTTMPAADPATLVPPRASTHRRSRFENQSPAPPLPLPPSSPSPSRSATITTMAAADPAILVPPRLSTHRRSRFQNDPNAAQPQIIPIQRTIKTATTSTIPADTAVLSPPKHLLESARRRSLSSSTCSFPEKQILSPPRNLVESAQRRSISSSTCFTDKISKKSSPVNEELKDLYLELDLNGFLTVQRSKILKLLKGEINGKAKIVLSGHSNSTSSMVAAICYAWLLDTKMRTKRNTVAEGGGTTMEMVVPVLNVRRGKMWKQRQAAWLFHHAGVDATAILFSNEIELEVLMMNKQLSILVVGQEILKTNDEVGSQCSILTGNYCEDSYDLLQNPILKKLMLAGILLDTQNLSSATTKDTEAARLLSVGSAPNYGISLYDQLTQEQKDGAFLEALRKYYGKPPNESNLESRSPTEEKVPEGKHQSPNTFEKGSRKDANQAKTSPFAPPAKPKPPTKQTPSPGKPVDPPREKGKNPFFLAKWFGFAK